MRTIRRVVALLSIVVVCATACEIPVEDTGGLDAPASPWAPPRLPPSTSADPGVERNVDPGPTTTTAAPVSTDLTLVAQTKGSDEVFALDGATVGTAFGARLVVEGDREIDHVTWHFDDTLFRDDDLFAPYTLRYAAVSFPIDKWMPSDQGLPGRFRAATGSTVELTATVHAGGTTEPVTAVFTIGDDSAPEPSAPSVTTTTVTTTSAPAPVAAPTTSAAPATTVPSTTTTTPAAAHPSGTPWSIAAGQDIGVTLPQGQLGPRTATRVDPATVPGISYGNGVWKMGRDWDETRDGGYLDFGAAALRPNGHRVLGFRIEVPAGISAGHVVDGGGEIGHFEITNPQQHPHNSFIRNGIHAHHYIARGVVGDAIKVGQGSSHHHDAYIEMNVRPGGPNDKHYDGAQIFKNGSARLERIVIEWNDAGTIANTTGAFFTQDSAALLASDLLVLNPGGTWQPLRLYGSGTHDVNRVQLIGARRPNNMNGKLAPTAAVKLSNGSATFTLWNGIDGTDDWLIG